MIVTIDGPAGSGKSTAARGLADKLGFFHLDTGAIYRSIAYLAKKRGISWLDEDEIEKIASNVNINFTTNGGEKRVIVDGEDVTEDIRKSDISIGASDIARHKKVRMALVDVQRRFALNKSIVAEGRDMGTVIFPNADVKFYLDASLEVRAKRRQIELLSKGIKEEFECVLEDIKRRDMQDSQRDIAPLKPAEDAIIINTDNMGIKEVLELLYFEVKKRWK
ncbi:MAG: (d)CMP kinase [Deltaproteobacteria bacterium]|nr:(d)CMP kinase [Deltaproteobacteria bacterium]